MESQDLLQLSSVNSSLPISGQQGNLFTSDPLQPPATNLNQSKSFSELISAGIDEVKLKVDEFDQAYAEIFGSSPLVEASTTTPELPTVSENFDSLIGDVSSLLAEVVWDSTVSTLQEQLETFTEDLAEDMFDSTVAKVGEQLGLLTTPQLSTVTEPSDSLASVALDLSVFRVQERLETFAAEEDFLDQMKQAFGDNFSNDEANTLIQDLASGEAIPTLEIVSAEQLNNANGAFGEGTIYLAEEFLSENVTNPEAVESVLLEEIGHYLDQELGGDSRGDEGDIFAELVLDDTISEAELADLQAEGDSTTIGLNGEEIDAELAAPPFPGDLFIYEPGNVTYNPDVEAWQQRMSERGWEIAVDGYYGSESESITRQFQQAKDLSVDGIVGSNTWQETFETGTPPFPGDFFIYESGNVTYNPDVEAWQQRLKDVNWQLAVDGYYGSESESIARQFQQAEEFTTVDGIVGPQTWEASFDEGAATPGTPSPPSDAQPDETGNFREDIVAIATQEWAFFDEGNLKETEEGAWQRVVEYWETPGIDNLLGVNSPEEVGDNDNPWSAAFISWVMNEGGAGDLFEYSASHSTYITDAIEDRENNDSEAAFFGYRLDEYSPQVGDLVGYARQDGVGYDTPAPYQSHTDLVVDVRDGEIDVIGGNVSDSVTKKTLAIDSEGRLIDESQDWFVVLSNQLGENPDNVRA